MPALSSPNRAATLATVDVCAFRLVQGQLEVLIVQRESQPHMNDWALPGSVVNISTDANLEECARRAVLAKTGIRIAYVEQVSTVGNGTRDPRGWSLAVIHLALLEPCSQQAQSLAPRARWVSVQQVFESLTAFDHAEILRCALTRLRSKSRYTTLPMHLLSRSFTLAELQQAFESCTECKLERKAFRRRMLESGVLQETGEHRSTGARPAAVFRASSEHSLHLFARTVGAPPPAMQTPETGARD